MYPHPIIAREGWTLLGILGALTILAWLFDCEFIAFLLAVAFIFSLQFFRDPPRDLPLEEDAIVSPVDGRVVKIEDAQDPVTGEDAKMISIFMNVFNVHSQKSPVDGVVEEIHYTAGKFFNADLDKASTENERNAVTVRMADDRRVTFIQIAGLIARRITCDTQVGANLKRGQRYGYIRFGSRVDVYLPRDVQVKVTIGERVTGTSSTLARW